MFCVWAALLIIVRSFCLNWRSALLPWLKFFAINLNFRGLYRGARGIEPRRLSTLSYFAFSFSIYQLSGRACRPCPFFRAASYPAIYLPCSSIIERTTFLSSSQRGSPNSMVRFTTSTSPASLTASLRKSVSSYACALPIRKSVRLSITSF